ncbi:MAG: ABC transporter permease [Ferruginibacter sp.]
MRSLYFLLQKEFRQIFRDPAILRIIFIMPVIQLVILPLAADYEIKNIQLTVIDQDHSTYTQKLIQKITASGYFKLTDVKSEYSKALVDIESDASDLILELPVGFEKKLVRDNEAPLAISVNAVNGVKANLGAAYLRNIIGDFNREVRMSWVPFSRINPIPLIDITNINRFNATMNYQVFMVPGILVILLTMIGAFLAALNIVKEKEIGTIEQINVTPIKKHHFILGKLIPFWVMGLVVVTIGLAIVRFVYGLHPVGSIFTIYIFSAVYLLAVLGLGLLISTYAYNQQQAMLIAFFVLMVFILLGGLYTSIDSMPNWAQKLTWFNPAAYFIEVMRMVMLKGSTLADISKQLLIVFGFALFFNGWAVFSYKKRS